MGVVSKHPEFGVWSLELGAWSLESGVWSLEFGAWSLESGVRSGGGRVVRLDRGPQQLELARRAVRVELDRDVLAEARAVVVALGLRVAERLEHRVGLHDAIVERRAAALLRGGGPRASGDVAHEYLGALGLAGDNDRLTLPHRRRQQQRAVGARGDDVLVRRQASQALGRANGLVRLRSAAQAQAQGRGWGLG